MRRTPGSVHSRLAPAASLVVALGLGAAAGCVSSESVSKSVSTSIESMSRSVQAMSGSISKSSDAAEGAPAESRAYRRDIRVVTAANLAAGASDDEMLRDLARVADEHGVVHWEGRSDTYRAIGAGLRDAGAGPAEMQRFADELTAGTPGPEAERALQWVLEGYRS